MIGQVGIGVLRYVNGSGGRKENLGGVMGVDDVILLQQNFVVVIRMIVIREEERIGIFIRVQVEGMEGEIELEDFLVMDGSGKEDDCSVVDGKKRWCWWL